MPVVMGAGASGILLHEAMGHAFEADFNRKGQSIFSDKMGCRICPSGINIIDDGTVSGNRGAVNFDDEGVPGQKTYMVEDGILTSYLHDRISAKWYGVTATGNGRRPAMRPGSRRGNDQSSEMRDRRGGRPDGRNMKEGPRMRRAEGNDSIMPRHQLTEEQKKMREDRLKKMKERVEAYNNAVKNIMTKEQFEEYSKGKE